MDDIKLFIKNEKELETLNTRSQNIQSGHWDGIWHRKMCHASYKKRKMTLYGWNGITKLWPNENAQRKGNLQISLGILEADIFKQEEMKEKIKKEYFRTTRKLFETKLSSRNLIKGINTWVVPPRKIFGAIFEVDQRRI